MTLTPHNRAELPPELVYPWHDVSSRGDDTKMVLSSAEGIYVFDRNGNKLIDGPAGMWCVNIGHGRREMADAIAAQVMALPYASPWYFGTDEANRLTERLTSYSPGDLNHVFYTTCGSTAVDSALRFVFFYNNCRGLPDKKTIIARDGAYHGSTFLSATCSGKAEDKNLMDMAEGVVHHISMPKPLDRPAGTTPEQFRDQLVDEFEQTILELGPETVGGYIAEPILASGGVIVPPPGYNAAMHAVCRKYDVLYISDEVVTGFGRLGEMFASEAVFDVVPDMITSAKGITSGYIPMGALFISDRMFDELRNHRADATYFSNGFTYSGHPVAVAAAHTNLDIIENEQLLEHVNTVGPYFQTELSKLAELGTVVEARGAGLMACVQLAAEPSRSDPGGDRGANDYALTAHVDKIAQANGLILRPFEDMCILSPPLIISRDQIDELVAILRGAISEATAQIGS